MSIGDLGDEFPQHLGMLLGDLDQSSRSRIRLTPTLLPILQRPYRYSQESGELRLGETGLLARSHDAPSLP